MPDWLLTTLFWLLLALGTAVVARALGADWVRQRFRHHRRCPKCWYDLSHSPGMTCSECGYAAKRERKLYKSRRRWRWAFASIVFFIGAYAAHVTPDVRERGWAAAVPTTGLILTLPYIEPDFGLWISGVRSRMLDDPAFQVVEELMHRTRDDDRSAWRSWLYGMVRISNEIQPEYRGYYFQSEFQELLASVRWSEPVIWDDLKPSREARLTVQSRRYWPLNVPIYATVGISREHGDVGHWLVGQPLTAGLDPIENTRDPVIIRCGGIILQDPWRERLVKLGTPAAPTSSLEYEVSVRQGQGSRTHWPVTRWYETGRQSLEVPVEVRGQLDEYLTPIHCRKTERAISELRASMSRDQQGNWNVLFKSYIGQEIDIPASTGPNRFTFAPRIEVMRNGRPFGISRAWFGFVQNWWQWNVFTLDKVDATIDVSDDDNWSVRIKGDREFALRNFDCDRYWDGEVSLPLNVAAEDRN